MEFLRSEFSEFYERTEGREAEEAEGRFDVTKTSTFCKIVARWWLCIQLSYVALK